MEWAPSIGVIIRLRIGLLTFVLHQHRLWQQLPMNPSHLFAPHRSSPSTDILMENKCDHLITQPHLRQCYEYVNWDFLSMDYNCRWISFRWITCWWTSLLMNFLLIYFWWTDLTFVCTAVCKNKNFEMPKSMLYRVVFFNCPPPAPKSSKCQITWEMPNQITCLSFGVSIWNPSLQTFVCKSKKFLVPKSMSMITKFEKFFSRHLSPVKSPYQNACTSMVAGPFAVVCSCLQEQKVLNAISCIIL